MHLLAGRGQWHGVGAGPREPQATFPDNRLIAQRQCLDEVMGVGCPRFLQLFLGGIRFAKAQIVRHSAMDQVSVLHDHRDMAAQHFKRQATNIVAAQQDAPLLRIEEAQQSQIMVDLPAPLGPTSPTCSPGLMVSEMCFNTRGRLG